MFEAMQFFYSTEEQTVVLVICEFSVYVLLHTE